MVTLQALVLIALAGGAGSIARVVLSGWIAQHRGAPFGIWAVNLSGSLVIGLAFAALTTGGTGPGDLRLLLITMGFLGGFTTVSTFALQVLDLVQDGALRRAGVLALGSALSCPLAALAGFGVGAALGAS